MKVKILLFSFSVGLIINSCEKDKVFEPQLNQDQESLDSIDNSINTIDGETDTISNKVDTIFSEIGDYSQIDINNYWEYENMVIIYLDHPPFTKDSITKTFMARFVDETIYDYKQFYKKNDSTFYHCSNGEYYKIDCYDSTKCFYYKYLDENSEIGSKWFSDTLQLSRGVFIHKEINIVAKSSNLEVCGVIYDEVIEVSETHIFQDPKNFDGMPFPSHFVKYHYAKDFGLVKKEIKIPDNSSNVTCLIDFGID